MEVSSRKEHSATVVTITGEMDAVTAPSYEERLNELIADGEINFVVDLGGLSYISSAGLRVILVIAKSLKNKDGQVLFANVKGHVRDVFDMSGFDSIFRICDSVAIALAEID